jgi:hypothetical protein
MSVPADQALATDPISPMGDGISIDSDQYAIYDQRKNQKVQQQKQIEQQAQQSAIGNLRQKAGMEAAQQPDEFQGQQPPTTMVPEIMKSMAPMMLLTALGGAFTKQSGMTMLGAMNGIVQGINKGDAEGRDRAWQQYQDTYKQWKDKVDEAHRIYEEHKAALGDNAFADMQAQKFANQVIHDENEQMSDLAGQMNKKYELSVRAAEAHSNLQMKMQSAQSLDEYRERSLADREAAAKAKTSVSNTDIDDAVNLIDGALKQLESGKILTGAGGMAHRGLETVAGIFGQGGTEAHDFQAQLSTLRTKLPGILTARKDRSSAQTRAQIDKIAPGLEVGANDKTTKSNLLMLKKHLLDLNGQGAAAPSTDETKTINGKTYIKKDGKWFEQ